MANCRTPLRGARFRGSVTVNILYLVMRQYVAPPSGVLYLVLLEMGFYTISCVNVTYRRTPFGGAISSTSVLGSCTIYSGATKCRAPLRGALGGTTSSGLAPLGILHLARPFGALRGAVSMRQNVAAPSGG